jgi:hypothetical protein
MDKKICELKLNELPAIVGGVISYTVATVYKAPTSSSWGSTSTTLSAPKLI